jgi:site-specific DNA-methyltransferase (adenine-specific)
VGAGGRTLQRRIAMQIVMRKTGDLIPYEKNPRLNDKAVEACVESIRQYGFKVPIIVDKSCVIVAGHTRLKAAKQLGLAEVPCIVADDLTDEQIQAFRLADNKVSDFSIWDNVLLLHELTEIEAYGMDLFTGFSVSDLPGLDSEAMTDGNPTLDPDEIGAYYELVLKSEDREKIERFKAMWDEVAGDE